MQEKLRNEFLKKHAGEASHIAHDSDSGFPLYAVYFSDDFCNLPEVRRERLQQVFTDFIEAIKEIRRAKAHTGEFDA